MLGIFLIICLTVFWLIKLKIYQLLNDDHIESVELGDEVRTYDVCHRAVILRVVLSGVRLLGYLGCMWPFLFIEGADKISYFIGIAFLGIGFPLAICYGCYLSIKNARGYIRISIDEIEFKRHKPFSIKISDIKKVTYPELHGCQIHLKEKGKTPLAVDYSGFYKRKEICSLMKQLREHCAEVSGRDKSLTHRFGSSKFNMVFLKYAPAFCMILIALVLLYTSYCCIDYDFFKRDYVAQFNALGADPRQIENAWPHYIQAVENYVELDKDFQEVIKDGLRSGGLDLTDAQEDMLRKWFDENASSWASLKKAISINYCNATYEHISLFDSTGRDDFSTLSDSGYGPIKYLYENANAGRLAGVLDLDWFDLFDMQLTTAKHFAKGKTLLDQLVGYAMLARSIKLLSKQESYEIDDLQRVRTLLKERFPTGMPVFSMEGEILFFCSTYEGMLNQMKIPVQTPLNQMFLMCGSCSGTEAYARKRYTFLLEQAQKGIEVEEKELSIINFPAMRYMIFGIMEGNISAVYESSQRASTNLLAAYFLLDLEEYKLMRGSYPVDVVQLKEAGLTCQLPDDPDADGKIIYHNDGQRAILYAVGRNSKDDGGYRDEKGTEDRRDDIIFWERDLKEQIGQ